MFGKQRKTTNANNVNESGSRVRSVKNSNMTSGSKSTKSESNSSVKSTTSVKNATNKMSGSKACGGTCKTKSANNKTTKSCS